MVMSHMSALGLSSDSLARLRVDVEEEEYHLPVVCALCSLVVVADLHHAEEEGWGRAILLAQISLLQYQMIF